MHCEALYGLPVRFGVVLVLATFVTWELGVCMSAIALVEQMVSAGMSADMTCKQCGMSYSVAPGHPESITHFGRRHLILHGRADFTGKVLSGKRIVATFSATFEKRLPSLIPEHP